MEHQKSFEIIVKLIKWSDHKIEKTQNINQTNGKYSKTIMNIKLFFGEIFLEKIKNTLLKVSKWILYIQKKNS